jgi:23S rRNA (uracil1939-C5)-methyltransferase
MRPRPKDRLVVTAERLDLEGRGVAEHGGEEVHVAGLLPGEAGEVVVEHVSRQKRRVHAVLAAPPARPAPERAERICPALCGGCAWQHLAYPAQLVHKRRRVEEALGMPVADVVPAPAIAGYRNKATYVIARRQDGVALGAWAPRSHDWIDTAGCRVVHPAITAAASAAAAALGASGLAVHDERTRAGQLRYVVARASRAGEVLLGIVTTSDAPEGALVEIAGALLPVARGVLWLPNDTTTGAILGDESRLLAGEPRIAESIDGIRFELAIDSFLQVNLDAAEAMYRRLAERLEPLAGLTAVDLYCGIGPIALTLARRGAEVIGIERNPVAIAEARAAAARNRIAARFEVAAATLPRAIGDRPLDIAVVNPPRQGLAAEVRAELAAAGPPVLAYVSCGPDSLGRDLAELASAYRVAAIEPFDLMPGTGHVETLVIARRP